VPLDINNHSHGVTDCLFFLTMVHSKQIVVAGLIVNVFSLARLADSPRPIVGLFFLHGRNGSASAIEGYVETILRESQPPQGLDDGRDLMIITFVCYLGHANCLRSECLRIIEIMVHDL